jgi:SAM-dependent methyltransferase
MSDPSAAPSKVLVPDIVTNGFILEPVPDESVDFVVGNHLLEHSPDLYGTIKRWLKKLRPGGVIFAALPIVDRCFDSGRVVTPVEHFFLEHEAFASANIAEILKYTQSHILDFGRISSQNILRKKGLPVKDYVSIDNFVEYLTASLKEEIESTKADSWDKIIAAHGNKINIVFDLHYHTFLPVQSSLS